MAYGAADLGCFTQVKPLLSGVREGELLASVERLAESAAATAADVRKLNAAVRGACCRTLPTTAVLCWVALRAATLLAFLMETV